jgi:hypothetical protein
MHYPSHAIDDFFIKFYKEQQESPACICFINVRGGNQYHWDTAYRLQSCDRISINIMVCRADLLVYMYLSHYSGFYLNPEMVYSTRNGERYGFADRSQHSVDILIGNLSIRCEGRRPQLSLFGCDRAMDFGSHFVSYYRNDIVLSPLL